MSTSHIILTGVDRTGKSYLAKELSKRFYMPVINRLEPKKNIFIECVDTLTEAERPFVIDRFHLDEEVYGPLKRGKSRFDFRQLKIIELSLLTLGSFNIFCYDSEENIKRRFREDFVKEKFLQEDEVSIFLKLYYRKINESVLTWHFYKIGDDIDDLAEKIKIKFTQNDSRGFNFFKEYRTLGSLDSEVLIVGDRYGDKLLPPLVPFGNNDPGLKLFQSIERSKLDWKKTAITNAYKLHLKEDIRLDSESYVAFKMELGLKNLKKVICLGNKAYDSAMRARSVYSSFVIKKILHPSSAFIYKNMTIEEYADMINDIL